MGILNSESLVVGSGLIAKAFAKDLTTFENIRIYAAGVSNSGCKDFSEFERERERLVVALENHPTKQCFVYFGTCSVYDAETRYTDYVKHKLEMEELVSKSPNYLILRLPQVVGHTPNPHTLLNFLYARIARSEAFSVWSDAYRNVIDVDDVVKIAHLILQDGLLHNTVINIANPNIYSMGEIVTAMEAFVGKPAIYDVIKRGLKYMIDINTTQPYINQLNLQFNHEYLSTVIAKYYEPCR